MSSSLLHLEDKPPTLHLKISGIMPEPKIDYNKSYLVSDELLNFIVSNYNFLDILKNAKNIVIRARVGQIKV